MPRTRLVFADARIDQDDPAADAQHERVYRESDDLAVHEVRLEPMPVGLEQRGIGIGKQPPQFQLEAIKIDNAIELGVADPD